VSLRLTVEDDDGPVYVLPVHLCFLYRESGAVRVTTELRPVPDLCLLPLDGLWPFCSGLLDGFAARTSFEDMLETGRGRLAIHRLVIHREDRGREDHGDGGWYDAFSLDGAVERRRYRGFQIYAHT
jgi:hypothetical protein